MFAKATTNLVSEIDPDGSLIPVRRLNDSDKLSPLALVIKRNRFWFWQRPKYLPTGFTLNDLLTGNQTIEPVVKVTDFLKYSGTFGDKMGTLVETGVGVANVSLEGRSSAKLQSSFGSLRKEELDVRKLLQDSKHKVLDLEHDLMEQVREQRRRVFGLVRERVSTVQECVVCEEVEDSGTCSGLFGVLTPAKIKVSVKQSGNLEYDSNVSLTIPANTTLLYSLIELEVKANGQYELCLLQDFRGGFESDSDSVDTVEKGELITVSMGTGLHSHKGPLLTDLEGVCRQLSPLACEPAGTRTALLQRLSELMEERVALDHLEQALEDLCSGVTPDLGSLDQDLKAQVMSFLELLPQAEGGQTDTSHTPLLTAAHLLVSALDEMSDEALSALSCCSPPVLQALQQLVLRLASEGACSPIDPALAQEEVFQRVKRLFAASAVNLLREEGTLKAGGGVLTGHLPLVMGIAVTGLAALGGSR
ncbi:gasdermin Eb [Clupea harengus]|uniref:Gasdermin Eb n=1 Tax=Clupea harengus TaxID=7950 RepID=A0A6P8GBY7_CLUHA|nr:gasdermin Eb [Clupea harengus]XP_031432606.1 gasdermin Eb [Clupea harengus]